MNFLLAAAEESEGFNPLSPEPGLYVWTLIAFIVVFFLLAKYIFPRLEETLADREKRIKEDLEKAEETKADAERILEEYKQRVAQAREESNKIIDDARQAAEQVRKDLVAKSESEARLIIDKAQNQLEGEKERTLGELQAQLAQWSTEIAGRIVERELDPNTQKQLVEKFIADIQKEGSPS
jgi:F-type H+-transporting ATPase subunit b